MQSYHNESESGERVFREMMVEEMIIIPAFIILSSSCSLGKKFALRIFFSLIGERNLVFMRWET